VPSALFSTRVVKQGNHPIENPQLKTDKGEIQLKEMSAVINFTLSSAATARSSGRTSAGRTPPPRRLKWVFSDPHVTA